MLNKYKKDYFQRKRFISSLLVYSYIITATALFSYIFLTPTALAAPQCFTASSLELVDCNTSIGFNFDDTNGCYKEARNQRNALTGYIKSTCAEIAETDVRNESRAAATTGNSTIETDCEPANNASITAENCQIVKYLVTGINFLSAIAGMVIVFSIMFAGYQYMIARDNAGAIAAAKTRIIWAIVALLMFIFTYTGLNFLVPGGVL